MFVYFLLVIVAGFAIWGGVEDYVGEVKNIPKRRDILIAGVRVRDRSSRFLNKDVFKAGVEGFFGNLLVGGVVAFLIFVFMFAFIFATDGDPQVTKSEVYAVAPNSDFDHTDKRFTFTSVEDNGKLKAVTTEYDSILFGGPESTVVVVFDEDQYHRWFAHWPLGTFTRIVVT